MKDEIGVIMYDGKIYDVEKMTQEELKELISKMEKDYETTEKDLKMRLGIFN